uniref:Uncharacterized protein n=1 Tax=Kalanchoe fedtschenkoi TaxID=63787 RepID=A0A7N0UUS8_KALFE
MWVTRPLDRWLPRNMARGCGCEIASGRVWGQDLCEMEATWSVSERDLGDGSERVEAGICVASKLRHLNQTFPNLINFRFGFCRSEEVVTGDIESVWLRFRISIRD